jgi:hypothetical protein
LTVDVIPGVAEDGSDLASDDWAGRLLAELQLRQEAVWAVVSQGRIVPATGEGKDGFDFVSHCEIYLPRRFEDWWRQNLNVCWSTLYDAVRSAWGWRGDEASLDARLSVVPILDVPDELVDFVAQNTDRPRPRRYNTTAVQYIERDGIAWLTPPEVKLYDVLKESGWLFVTQPPFLAGDDIDRRPDFLIFWRQKAQYAVLVEVDSDKFHGLPSQRELDEKKERLFESRGFQYLRFSAKMVLDNPVRVLQEITDYCTRKFGA